MADHSPTTSSRAPPPILTGTLPRRLSDPNSSDDDDPSNSALDSSAALILVHDDDDDDDRASPFSDLSSDDNPEDDEVSSPQFEIRRASVPPLPPVIIFLYLLAPQLKLGALLLPYAPRSLSLVLPELFVFAALAVFARQVWYMLARYVRRADIEDIVLDTFARGRGKERRRALLRGIVRAVTGMASVLITETYLRESVNQLLPLLSINKLSSLLNRFALTLGIGVFVFLLSTAKSLGSKRTIYATWLGLLAYTVWLGCVTFAHSRGILSISSGPERLGTFWQGLTASAFAFTSSSTLPLYASLKGTSQHISTAKTPRTRSFRLLSTTSTLVAVLLILPSAIFSAYPNNFESRPHENASFATLPVDILTSDPVLTNVIAIFSAVILILGIPPFLVTAPTLPISERIRRSARFNVSKFLFALLVIILALVPDPGARVLHDILLAVQLLGTYAVPALVHICTHFFKTPLSIVVPYLPGTPLIHTPAASHSSINTPAPQSGLTSPIISRSAPGTPRLQLSSAGQSQSQSGVNTPRGQPFSSRGHTSSSAHARPSHLNLHTHDQSVRTIHDELLLRKERALQRRQMRKRVGWDIGVWILFGIGVLGVVGACGRLAQKW